jgi:hypothetical protein
MTYLDLQANLLEESWRCYSLDWVFYIYRVKKKASPNRVGLFLSVEYSGTKGLPQPASPSLFHNATAAHIF